MSITSTLSPITLADKDKLKGYENYASWKILMEAHGKPKGLHKYWTDKIIVPGGYETASEEVSSEEDDTANTSKPKKPTTPPKEPSPKTPGGPTPLHSTTPSELEYELRGHGDLVAFVHAIHVSTSGTSSSCRGCSTPNLSCYQALVICFTWKTAVPSRTAWPIF